jgi:hypothetical protein
MDNRTVSILMDKAKQAEESKGVLAVLEELFHACDDFARAVHIIQSFIALCPKGQGNSFIEYAMQSIVFHYYWGYYDNL